MSPEQMLLVAVILFVAAFVIVAINYVRSQMRWKKYLNTSDEQIKTYDKLMRQELGIDEEEDID